MGHVESNSSECLCPMCRGYLHDLTAESDWVYISDVEKMNLVAEFKRRPFVNGEGRPVCSDEEVVGEHWDGGGHEDDSREGGEKREGWFNVSSHLLTWITVTIIFIAASMQMAKK